MEFINISNQNVNMDFDRNGLKKLIILPDYSPLRSRLPVGSVAVYSDGKHIPSSDLIGPDVGCGMLLAKFKEPLKEDLEYIAYSVASNLKFHNKGLGSLGGGNHFINIYQTTKSNIRGVSPGDFFVLIHTGSRLVGKKLFEQRINDEEKYTEQQNNALDYAKRNRRALLNLIEEKAGTPTQFILDLPHNYLERQGNYIIYRKGAVKLTEKEMGVIPSNMSGEAILITPKESLKKLEDSICHGTGRIMSRSDAREIDFDSSEIRKRVYIPHFISDDEIRTENPMCYRSIENLIPQINDYVNIVATLSPKAFIC